MRSGRVQLALALSLCAATGCNLLLGNEKRSLTSELEGAPEAGPPNPPPPREDSSTPKDGAVETGNGSTAPDAGPIMSIDSGSEAGPPPVVCASPDLLAECTPGAIGTEKQACGLCMRGMQIRSRTCAKTCGWEPYSDWTPCQEDPEACEPNKVDERVARCGPCEKGRLISQRTCKNDCSWSDWSEQVCEMDPLHCTPGKTQALPDLPCGQRCGVIKQTKTCNAACTWDPVVESACVEAGVCTPGETKAAPDAACNAEYCMKGVLPQKQLCSAKCTWDTPTANGMCTIPLGVCRPADLGGVGYRCSPDRAGYRDLCNPSTANAANRCTWGQREPFPSCS